MAKVSPRLSSARAKFHASDRKQPRGAPSWLIEFTVVSYVLLWGFEGAVRKWVPGTETVLYIVRDALLITVFLSMLTFTRSQAAKSWWLWVLSFLMLFIAGFHVIEGLTSTTLAVNGARSYIAPVLLFAFVQVFSTPRLVTLIVLALAVVALVNLPVAVVQVLSSPSSFINKEVGADVAHFVNSGDIVRPSGTFSAPAGFSAMLPLAMVSSLIAMLARLTKPMVAVSVVVAVITMALISGARSALASVAVVLVAFAWIQLRRGSGRAFVTLVLGTGLLVLVYQVALGFFPLVFDSFATRIEQASTSEDVVGRVLNSIFGFFNVATEPLGSGLGAFTSAAVLVSGSEQWVETENARWAVELGVLGVLFAIARLTLGAIALVIGFAGRAQDMPAQKLLYAYLGFLLFAGTINQIPTHQGAFAVALALLYLIGKPPASSVLDLGQESSEVKGAELSRLRSARALRK